MNSVPLDREALACARAPAAVFQCESTYPKIGSGHSRPMGRRGHGMLRSSVASIAPSGASISFCEANVQNARNGVPMNGHTGPIRVVLADDHPIVLLAVSDQFSKLPGFTITATVNSGAELIRVLEKEPADLVITDLVMQGDEEVELDGLRLVSRLRRSYPDVP